MTRTLERDPRALLLDLRRAPETRQEPQGHDYAPEKWNDSRFIRENVCSHYARNDFKEQRGPLTDDIRKAADARRREFKDFGEYAKAEAERLGFIPAGMDMPEIREGHYRVAVFVDLGNQKSREGGSSEELHFVRQDRDGFWSQKLGTREVSRLIRQDGNLVTDPRDANLDFRGPAQFGPWGMERPGNNFHQFAGFYYYPLNLEK